MLQIGLVAVIVIAGGHFAGFTYVRAALETITHLPPTHIAGVLLLFGFATFLGNLACGAVVDRHLRLTLAGAALFIGLAALGFAAFGAGPIAATVAVAVWGFGFGGAPLVLQTWTARAAADHLEAMGGPLVAAFQIAIASGAAIGGVIVDHWGVDDLLLGMGVLVSAGSLLALVRAKP
jgi:DHA1 family purine ribonucleoside efflux pump-like MFS transporter